MSRLKTARIFFSVLFIAQWMFIIGIITLCFFIGNGKFLPNNVNGSTPSAVIFFLIFFMILLGIVPMFWCATMLYDIFLCRRDDKEKR